MFIELATHAPQVYVAIVTTIIVSIVLHELAHGWAAIWQGDDTPRVLGHLTPNPLTHMGAVAIVMAFIAGISWGAMPVNRSRFRSRYGDALVSLAGPLMNLLLALVGLTALALWVRHGPRQLTETQMNFQMALRLFGEMNIALAVFNMIPVPPLDGSRIMANLNPRYDQWLREHEQELGNFLFFAVLSIIMAINHTPYGLYSIAGRVGEAYFKLLGGTGYNLITGA